VIHPQGLSNQIKGAAVMGIGLACMERHVYDPKLGLPANIGLYDCKPPTYLDAPMDSQWDAVGEPDSANPYGIKGVGEPIQGCAAAAEAFHRLHEERYGHRLEAPVELVNLRVALEGPDTAVELEAAGVADRAAPRESVTLYGFARPVPRYERGDLAVGQLLVGPVLITEEVSTTWIEPGWSGVVDRSGSLLLERTGAAARPTQGPADR